jgi:alpha/beta superfamily hydrolase
VPLLVLQGEADEVVPVADVKKWIARLESEPRMRLFPGAGHFFHGRLNDLRAAVHEELSAFVPRADRERS